MHPFGSSASKARGIDVESRGETCGAAREGLLLEPTGDEWSKLFVGRVAESPIRVLAGSPRQTKCWQGRLARRSVGRVAQGSAGRISGSRVGRISGWSVGRKCKNHVSSIILFGCHEVDQNNKYQRDVNLNMLCQCASTLPFHIVGCKWTRVR